MKRKILFSLLPILITFGAVKYFTLSDLRSEYVLPADDTRKVETLLASMAVAHQTHLWDKLASYQVQFSDEFYGFVGNMGNPFPDAETKFNLKYQPRKYTGQLELLTGEDQGLTWGILEGITYRIDQSNALTVDEDPNIQFWLPTYQYFIEFPWRIQEATSFRYMGKQQINGQACEGILASWNTVEPQRNIDQYIVWISEDSNLIVKVEYTIREMYPFLTGAAFFEGYEEFGEFLLPTVFPVESNLVSDGLLHTMKLIEFHAQDEVPGDLNPF